MDVNPYLKRIYYDGSLDVSAETLRKLQVAHLFNVPFENLSIHASEPIVLADEALFTKIVERRRGGFCYEANGLFAALLRAVGFNVSMLSAEVARSNGQFSPPFDHMAHDPGYIKGYVPGVRENGGQYTHAAAWTAIAFAMQGKAERAMEVFNMMNPVRRASSRADVQRYKVEPYVVAADVYAHPAHAGRGGWTWYTGSASWMYRAGLESILGIERRGGALSVNPCIPFSWPGFSAVVRFGTARYEITVDGEELPPKAGGRASALGRRGAGVGGAE